MFVKMICGIDSPSIHGRVLGALLGVILLLGVGAGAFWLLPPRGDVERPYFLDITDRTGITIETTCGAEYDKRFIIEENGSGVGLLDYDLDGDLDVYVVNGADLAIMAGERDPVSNALYRNDGGWKFTDVTAEAGVGDTGWGYGCAAGDIDGDGDPDLYVTNFGPNVLYRNLGDGTFQEIGKAAGVDDDAWGESCGFGDIDNDGDLDLYVACKIDFDLENPPNGGKPCISGGVLRVCGPKGLPAALDRLYRNDGTGMFLDISEESGIHDPEPKYGLGVAFLDWDDDGWVDIYVANDSVPNLLFHNRGEGKFEEVGQRLGVSCREDGDSQAGMGIAVGDANGDEFLDIFVTNFEGDYFTLYLNMGGHMFQDMTFPAGLGAATTYYLGWGTGLFDFDNDTDLDLFCACGHVYHQETDDGSDWYYMPNLLLLNDGTARFTDASEKIRIQGDPKSSRGAGFGDIDNDGDVDIVVIENHSRPTVMENVGGTDRSWVRIILEGVESNRFGIGARVWVTAGGVTMKRQVTASGSYCSSSDPRLLVGLGDAERIDGIKVVWPSGKTQRFTDLPVRQDIRIHEDKGIH